jgi:hypothetical protein
MKLFEIKYRNIRTGQVCVILTNAESKGCAWQNVMRTEHDLLERLSVESIEDNTVIFIRSSIKGE